MTSSQYGQQAGTGTRAPEPDQDAGGPPRPHSPNGQDPYAQEPSPGSRVQNDRRHPALRGNRLLLDADLLEYRIEEGLGGAHLGDRITGWHLPHLNGEGA